MLVSTVNGKLSRTIRSLCYLCLFGIIFLLCSRFKFFFLLMQGVLFRQFAKLSKYNTISPLISFKMSIVVSNFFPIHSPSFYPFRKQVQLLSMIFTYVTCPCLSFSVTYGIFSIIFIFENAAIKKWPTDGVFLILVFIGYYCIIFPLSLFIFRNQGIFYLSHL